MAFVGDPPSAAERWQDDCFYGSHFLNGCNPDTIKRCTELPSKFPVTQELVGNLLDEGDTLQNAIEVSKSRLHAFHLILFIQEKSSVTNGLRNVITHHLQCWKSGRYRTSYKVFHHWFDTLGTNNKTNN